MKTPAQTLRHHRAQSPGLLSKLTATAASLLISALFADAQQSAPPVAGTNASPSWEYSLETIHIETGERNVVYRTRDHIEAPNWSRDGQYLLYNLKGSIYKLPVTADDKPAVPSGAKPQLIETGVANKCNNDHGISFDGKLLAVSSRSDGNKSQIYVLPVRGGEARLVTPLSPSYWHGWSPDDKTLTYCAERNGNFDIYTIPTAGGEEKRLTTNPGLDDGPEYSPDGGHIYFNSEREGTMQIWRMKPDGSSQEAVVADEYRNWFPHLSPDGKWMVFISFGKDVIPDEHPENRDVMLRLMPTAGGEVRELARLFGGQGTLNVPSWSPDSKKVAFVSVTKPVPPDWSLPSMPKPTPHKQVPPPEGFHRPSVTINKPLGIFEGQADVGGPLLPGNANYFPSTGQYRLTSASYNIWYQRDELRYAWKQMSGDVSLSASITFPNREGYYDRKAVLMFRQDLNDDSKTVMVALHGAGLIHLAKRSEKGAKIVEACRVQAGERSSDAPPIRLGITKRGDVFTLLVSLNGEPMHEVETKAELCLDAPFYVGIGFCSHLPVTSDTAVLSDVELK